MKKELIVLIGGALGFIVALEWRDAIFAWLTPIIGETSGALALTIIAIALTVAALFALVVLKKLPWR
jgi:hypothetical protein